MPHGPAYDFASDEKPDVFWEKPDGSFLGFWTREWPDLLGEAVLKETDKYDWEVWQPDCRADKIYSKKLETGATHFLFPAGIKSYRPGLRSLNGIYSENIISHLKKLLDTPFILQLHGFRIPFYNEVLARLGPVKSFPVFLVGHGVPIAPISELMGLHRPLTYLCLLKEQSCLKKLYQYLDLISMQTDSAISEIRKLYSGRIKKLTMGCDFNFWVPVPSQEEKNLIRNNLKIDHKKKVFLTTGNFVPLKQFDKILGLFRSIQKRNDFFLIIAGHGDEAYTRALGSLAEPLILENKAVIHPYVTGGTLRDLYWASDLYFSVSTSEGSSVSIMKAMACGLPILATSVGETSEKMIKHNAGRFLPVRKNDEWRKAILEILGNKLPDVLDREIAKEAYDWPNVAKQFIRTYDNLFSGYYRIN